jgi:hypothetical protein
MDKNTLQDLIKLGLSQRQIATKMDTSQVNVRYWLKNFSLSTLHLKSIRQIDAAGNIRCYKCGENSLMFWNINQYGTINK